MGDSVYYLLQFDCINFEELIYHMEPTFFTTTPDLRAWFEEHHATAQELWVGFYKKSSGKTAITWPEAVDQALCFGWIDSFAVASTMRAIRIASHQENRAATGAL